ncbi:MAG: ATP-binding protein [Myxococcota bacterium]|nr:ATP-binding protein [Myxococcota bacterium]
MDDLAGIQAALEGAPRRISVTVRRGSEFVQRDVDIRWHGKSERLRRYSTAAFGALSLFAALAFLLLRSRSRAPVALLVLQSCVLSVFMVGASGPFGSAPQVAAITVLCLVPAALVHLGLVFPNLRPVVESYPKILCLPYAVSVPLALFGGWSVSEAPFFWRLFPPLLGGLLLVSWSWLLSSCWFSVRESPIGVARARARVLLVGSLGSCFLFFIGAYQLDAPQPVLFALAGAPLLLPLSVGLAISQYDLFSLPYRTRRSVASGLVAAAYAAAAVGTAWIVFNPLETDSLAEALALLFGIFVFLEKGRRGIFSSLEAVLMRRAAQLSAEASRLEGEVADIQEQRAVCQSFVEAVSTALGGAACAVHLRTDGGLFCSAAIGEGRVAEAEVIRAASEMLRADVSVLHLGNLGESIVLAESRLLEMGVEIVVPVRHGPLELGVALVGCSGDGTSYGYEEGQFLTEACRTLGHAIHRSGLVEGLVQAERRATTGRVGLAIAHEVGKQLGCIELLAGNISDSTGDGGSAVGEISRVAREGQQALADFIREAKRPEGGKADQATVVEVVDDTRRIACSGGCSVPVVVRIDPSLGQARVPRILVHALVGILDNALAASDANDAVSISVLRSELGATVAVEDRGKGIEASLLSRVETLGFSTRMEAGGQGVGLAVASEILKSVGASLSIRSALGVGTTVTVGVPGGILRLPGSKAGVGGNRVLGRDRP